MTQYDFYEIKTLRSHEIIEGHRKTSYSCADHQEIFCFVWFDKDEKMTQLQLIFDEKIINWEVERGLTVGETNRRNQLSDKTGIHKGSRTIIEITDQKVKDEGLLIINNSNLPESYKDIINK